MSATEKSVQKTLGGKQSSPMKKPVVYLASFLVVFACPAILPAWSTITPMGVKMLCTFVGVMLILLTTGDVIAGSLMGLLGMLLHQYIDAAGLWQGLLGNSIAGQIIMMLAFTTALSATGAFNVLGRWLVSKSGRLRRYPMLFNLVFTLCLYFCTFHMTGLAFVYTLLPMYESILQAVGYKKEDTLYKIMIMGGFMFSAAAAMVSGFSGMGMSVISVFEKSITIPYTYVPLEFMLTARIGLAVFIALYHLAAKFLFHCDFSKLRDANMNTLEELRPENCKFEKKHFIMLGLFAVILVRAFMPNIFPEGSAPYNIYEILSFPFVIMITLVVASCIMIDGKPVVELPKAFAGVQWFVLLSMGTFTMMVGSFTSEETGIRSWLLEILSPIFGGHHYFVFVVLILLFTSFFTNLMSNQATMIIMTTVASAFMEPYMLAGYNPTPLLASIVAVATLPLLTYGAGPQAPVFLSRPEMDKKFVYTIGIFMMLLSCITLSVMAVVFGRIM